MEGTGICPGGGTGKSWMGGEVDVSGQAHGWAGAWERAGGVCLAGQWYGVV